MQLADLPFDIDALTRRLNRIPSSGLGLLRSVLCGSVRIEESEEGLHLSNS